MKNAIVLIKVFSSHGKIHYMYKINLNYVNIDLNGNFIIIILSNSHMIIIV